MATRATKKSRNTSTTTATTTDTINNDDKLSHSDRARGWCFTLFPDVSNVYDDKATCPIEWPNCVWGIVSIEKAPNTGRIHFQGAVYYKSAQRMSRLKSDFGDKGHYEIMKGSPQQSETYCSKDNTHIAGPWSTGTIPHQGKRTDWDQVKTEIQEKKTFNDIVLAHPHLAPAAKGIHVLMEAALPAPQITRTVTVFYLWGPTGVGKTHRALMTFPNAYLITGKYIEGKMFDQYFDEATLVLDEWDPMEWPLTTMNTLLSQWKCPLQCRYANKYARWERVIITSNHNPNQVYTLGLRPTFLRRLDYITEIKDQNQIVDLTLVKKT